jgi:ubiquinone biosynthesis protein
VPTVDWERTGRDVLTMEWIDGIKPNDVEALRAAGHRPRALGRTVIQSFLRHALRDGFFHADMHQGNLFVDADGTIVAVDFGIMGGSAEGAALPRRNPLRLHHARLSPRRRGAFRGRLRAARISVASFAQAIRAIGEPIHGPPAETRSPWRKLLTLLFEVTGTVRHADAAGTHPAAEDDGGGRGRRAHARPAFDMWKTSEPVVRDWITRNLGPRGMLDDARDGLSALAVAGPSGAGPRRANGTAVARDRPDGRAWPALRRRDGQGHRQGRGTLQPLRAAGAVGHRGGGGVYRLGGELIAFHTA